MPLKAKKSEIDIEEKDIDNTAVLEKNTEYKKIDWNKKISFKRNKKDYINKEAKTKSVNLVGIDIGTYETKIVEGKYKNDKLHITKLGKFKSPKDMYQEGNLLNQDVLVLTLKNNLKELGIKTKNISITSASSTIINREIVVPYVEDERELRNLVSYQVQQFLCINLNNYDIQFIVIDDFFENDVRKLKLFTVIYPKNIISSYKDLCIKLFLNPYALDVSNNAIRKIHQFSSQYNSDLIDKDAPVLYMDIGNENVNLTIIDNDNLEFMRTLPIGGSEIDSYISENMNISIEEAQKVKAEKVSLYGDSEFELSDGINDIVDEWVVNLNRILQFYTNKSKGKKVSKIYIFGGNSKIKGIDKYLSEKLKVSVERIRTIDSVEFTEDASVVTIEEYINAIGALIRL